MSCSRFEDTLHYSSPAHGGWGVVRMGHLMPESYQLFVSPSACGRHGAIGACMQGRKNRVSYLYISESDIVSGGYEDLIVEAAGELLEELDEMYRRPKVLMIFVSCLDDLLGTDHQSLTEELSALHPDVRFVFCHMNPTSTDTSVPPPVNIQDKLYSLLDVQDEKKNTVNFIGNLAAIRPDCEIFRFLKLSGIEHAYHITDFRTFAGFQVMGGSRLNLVTAQVGQYAAKQMEKKHGIPYYRGLVSYDPDQVERMYQKLADTLEVPVPQEIKEEKDKTLDSIKQAALHLNGLPVIPDDGGVERPFDMARALLRYGFNVPAVISQKVIPIDKEPYEWIREHHPQVQIWQPQHHKSVLFEHYGNDCLCIGYNAGYMTGSRYVVSVDGKEGLYGYSGIRSMMAMMMEAADRECDLKAMVEEAGLVV